MKLCDSYKESGARYDKVRSPEETLSWVRERLDRLDMPVLQETSRIDQGRLGIPVYISRYTPEAAGLTGTYKQMGKGVTAAQAEASAIMELVERFSLFWYRDNHEFDIMLRRELDGALMPLSHMARVFSVSDSAGQTDVAQLEKIVDMLPLRWSRGICPVAGVHPLLLPFSWFWPVNEYNGSAAGNSLEEAAVQAVSEVVERHVCSVISRDMLNTPEIDLESFTDPAVIELVQRFVSLGIRVVLKDFSLDTGIPTVGAVAWDPSTFPDRSEIVYTAGTSPDPNRAVIRALTEVAQLAGDFDTDGQYVESGLPKFDSLEEMDYVLSSDVKVPVTALPDCSSDNFREELLNMCSSLENASLSVYLVDITHPVLEVPAVYAVIPGNQFRDRTIGLDPVFHCSRVAAGAFHDSPDQAVAALQELQATYPERFETAFFLGHVCEVSGDYETAARWYRRAAELESGSEEASIRCHLGVCLRETGDVQGAIRELQAARDLNPGLKEIHNQLGFCYYSTGDYYRAIECFEAAIEIDPGSAIDYANIGSNLRKLGMPAPALKWYEMALELDPGLEWAAEHAREIRQSLG